MRFPATVRHLSAMLLLLGCAVQSAWLFTAARPAAQEKRELIGTVLEKPVYRDQICKEQPVADELHRLFLWPVISRYRQGHQITPTPAEIDNATAYFEQKLHEEIKDRESELRDKLNAVEAQLQRQDLPAQQREELEAEKETLDFELNPPLRSFAELLLNNWKFQRHLFDKFGGGRILWQQAGIEAFDSMLTFLKTEEINGTFEINDAALRAKCYEYWTTYDHGPFLIEDEDVIYDQFLEPEWARPNLSTLPKAEQEKQIRSLIEQLVFANHKAVRSPVLACERAFQRLSELKEIAIPFLVEHLQDDRQSIPFRNHYLEWSVGNACYWNIYYQLQDRPDDYSSYGSGRRGRDGNIHPIPYWGGTPFDDAGGVVEWLEQNKHLSYTEKQIKCLRWLLDEEKEIGASDAESYFVNILPLEIRIAERRLEAGEDVQGELERLRLIRDEKRVEEIPRGLLPDE